MPVIDRKGTELRKGDKVMIPGVVMEILHDQDGEPLDKHQNVIIVTDECHYPYAPFVNTVGKHGKKYDAKTQIGINSRQCEKVAKAEPEEKPAKVEPVDPGESAPKKGK